MLGADGVLDPSVTGWDARTGAVMLGVAAPVTIAGGDPGGTGGI